MTYIPTPLVARAAEAIGQAIGQDLLPDAAGVRFHAGADHQARLDGAARSVHFYSRHKAEIRAENLQTLGIIRDVLGSRFGQTSLRHFEMTLSAGVQRGDKPLTARQIREVFRGAGDLLDYIAELASGLRPMYEYLLVRERQAWFLEKSAPPLPRQMLEDAIAAGEGLLAEGANTVLAKNLNAALQERLEVLRASLQGNADPLGEGAFKEGVIGMFAAATHLLHRLPEGNPDRTRLLLSLNDALRSAMTDIDRTAIAPGADALREIRKSAQGAIGAILKQLVGMTLEDGNAPLTKSDVQRLIKEENIHELNRAGRWEPIARTVTLPVRAGEIPLQVTSTITPAGHTGATFAQDYCDRDGAGQVTGVSSTDTGNRHHAVNLALSTLADAGGNTLFRAVRHGVCSAFGIGNNHDRQAANKTRVVELLTLAAQEAVRANPALLDEAQDGALEIPLVSLSLLTPDSLRRGAGNEAQFLREQNVALRALAKEPPTITLALPEGGTRQIQVRPQLAAFNFPVNAAPQGNALAQLLVGGYFTSHGQNETAFAALLGERFMRTGNPADLGGIAGTRLGNLPEAEQETAHALARQCRELWQSGGHRDRRETPYRLPARLAALTNLLGFPPAFNCKSGKDRTGQMDVEAKTIAVFIAQHHRPPSLAGPDKADDDAALQRIRLPLALEGGNHEMQIKNTGFAGFKTLGVRGLTNALGGPQPMMRVIGFSRLVKD
ncbi:MAG: hypothetical protein LBF93_03520 [Zoogloeaceae bacterium]|jgi:hypothetical protein|nr:hypothetical protein [Zoogloeaceae bacterium]